MPTKAQLESALKNAHNAGDASAAKQLANALKQGRYSEPTQTTAPAPTAPKDFDFDASKMVKNIPGSAKQYAGDIWNAISNPVDTAKAVGNLGAGVVQKAIPGDRDWETHV